MKAFFGSRISDNMAKTPEGYLVCYDVPIARPGSQDYYGHEIGIEGTQNANQLYKVDRPEEEVFSDATLASFEGKTFTNDHPSKLIDVTNTKRHCVGHAQNIRVSEGKEYIIADIIVTDNDTIIDIENGKREISAGYECEWVETNGGFTQTNIRGNHVALVDKGRAGNKVRINDEKGEKTMALKGKKRSILAKMFNVFAMDEETKPEELVEASKLLNDADEEQEVPPKKDVEDEGEDALSQIMARLDKIEAQVQEMIKKDEEVHENALDALEEEVAKDEEGEEKPESEVDDEEAEEEKPVEDEDLENNERLIEANGEKAQSEGMDKEAVKKLIADAKKAVAGIEDAGQRKAVSDHFARLIRGQVNSTNYKKILDASAKPGEHAKPQTKVVDYEAQYKAIKDKNFRK